MTDEQLIALICYAWLQNGGDSEGFSWNWRAILDELRRREREVDCA